MTKEAKTIQERRALRFAVYLVGKYGYGYTITVPSRQLSDDLSDKGYKISFMTVIAYWKTLERMGYVKREMSARINGVTYYLNRYALKKLMDKGNNETV